MPAVYALKRSLGSTELAFRYCTCVVCTGTGLYLGMELCFEGTWWLEYPATGAARLLDTCFDELPCKLSLGYPAYICSRFNEPPLYTLEVLALM